MPLRLKEGVGVSEVDEEKLPLKLGDKEAVVLWVGEMEGEGQAVGLEVADQTGVSVSALEGERVAVELKVGASVLEEHPLGLSEVGSVGEKLGE